MSTVKAIIFDFDGTISTLRAGWEEVMIPFMQESIAGGRALTEAEEARLKAEVESYVDQSTGIQTVFQMQWLAETVRRYGWNNEVMDQWQYKAEYNRLLMEKVERRLQLLESGELEREHFLIKGSEQLLDRLRQADIALYVASGTDHPDVEREAKALGVYRYFAGIHGAPLRQAECPKEKIISDLLGSGATAAEQMAVIGDGKVEITLAKASGAAAYGLASDELRREGINPVKEARLLAAGADWIAGDFLNLEEWLGRLGLG
ncbi:hypothetical protein B1748_09295 [Paenibacillus sp. MY03]|uniref:HAD family hydrolase n=1 Tax=Paenibacillus sp. MY03 TaxID=302980 RepID=UPI000B3C0324|nr:HAD family hydrolase [Paenibacillus sp. MY03]OUS76778.1 hypothetical protein B1748_09295 [Paenibacillus sp. MY03]